MTAALLDLIAEARVNTQPADCCRDSHDWSSDGEGGRTCPKGDHNNRSQTVYRCRRCGQFDYGQPGGPAWTECQRCPCETIQEANPPAEGQFCALCDRTAEHGYCPDCTL